MSSLLDDIRVAARSHGPSCTVGILLDTLPESDRADLQAAFTDPLIRSTTISRVLRGRGNHILDQTIQRHRRGECQCQG